MKYTELDTPSLLIDNAILESNLRFMQDYANAQGVALRPHTKTHKMPAIALMQMELGAGRRLSPARSSKPAWTISRPRLRSTAHLSSKGRNSLPTSEWRSLRGLRLKPSQASPRT